MADNLPSKPNNDDIQHERRLRTYEVIFTMVVKSVLIIAGLVAFFIVLAYMLTEPNPVNKGIFGFFDTALGFTVYKIYNHYFPGDPNKPPTPPKRPKLPPAKDRL